MTDHKRCSTCGDEKPRSEFYKSATSSDGFQGQCKACKRAYTAAYRKANPERKKATNAAYYAANPDKIKAYEAANKERRQAYRADYYEANKERLKATNKAYREANKEQIKAYRAAYKAANKDRERDYKAAYYKANYIPSENPHGLDPTKPATLYLILTESGITKFGITGRPLDVRVGEHRTDLGPLKVVETIHYELGSDAQEQELVLKRLVKDKGYLLPETAEQFLTANWIDFHLRIEATDV